jgi:tetratricopeptide (TPR) repeat protein
MGAPSRTKAPGANARAKTARPEGAGGRQRGSAGREDARDSRRTPDKPAHPAIPATITADQLDPAARAELRTLPGDLADAVARLLVAVGQAEDPERGYQYAVAARALAARVGVVREACGIAAYRAERWAEALAELRAARRLTGQEGYLPLMADCERALGRLDRALDLVTAPQTDNMSRETQIELRIVESGIRRDQGFPEAAVVALQIPELTDGRIRPGSARLYYAYADALLDVGRHDEARYWFGKAAAADVDGDTDAAERVEDMDMLVFDDLEEAEEAGDPGDGDGHDVDGAGDLVDSDETR